MATMNTNSDTIRLRRVLLVDDEANIVKAITRELTNPPFGRYLCEVAGFTDPREALERAKTTPFDLVISDYRMPEMDGITFLRALADIQPECASIVLSAQTDAEALIKMVNQAHIFRFVPKPWHDYFLKGSIFQALDYYGVLQENSRLVESVKSHNIEIPPLVNEVDHVLVVHSDQTLAKRIAEELTSRSSKDKLISVIRSEIHRLAPVFPAEGSLSVDLASSPLDALIMANDRTYSCIITPASTVPDTKGVTLLQAFADKYPDSARFLINDGMGMDELIAMMDLAHISGVINLPLNEVEMKVMVASALARRKMMIQNRVLADLVRLAK
jgi:two-component system probable response regulator PhcQ